MNKEAELFETFKVAHKKYPSGKRSKAFEFEHLKRICKKNKLDCRTVVPLLLPAISEQEKWRERMAFANKFVPNWKYMQGWITECMWTFEIPQTDQAPKPKPKCARCDAVGTVHYSNEKEWFCSGDCRDKHHRENIR